jgi:hypothetical protein
MVVIKWEGPKTIDELVFITGFDEEDIIKAVKELVDSGELSILKHEHEGKVNELYIPENTLWCNNLVGSCDTHEIRQLVERKTKRNRQAIIASAKIEDGCYLLKMSISKAFSIYATTSFQKKEINWKYKFKNVIYSDVDALEEESRRKYTLSSKNGEKVVISGNTRVFMLFPVDGGVPCWIEHLVHD